MRVRRLILSLGAVALVALPGMLAFPVNGWAQITFGGETALTTGALGPSSVYVADLDGDGDFDVLSTSYNDRTVG